MPATQECIWCHHHKPLDDFSRRVIGRLKRQLVCKDCHAENMRQNHNILDKPVKTRRSPYENMRETLDVIQDALDHGRTGDAIQECKQARIRYAL
jgi:hypothetical protein